MICLLDIGLFVLDVAAWNSDRSRCLLPRDAMLLHMNWLARYRVSMLWTDEFFLGFPWNQPKVPAELIDFCNVVLQFHSQMQANGLLITPQTSSQNAALPEIVPDLLQSQHLTDFREMWLQSLVWLVCRQESLTEGAAIPTWQEQAKSQMQLQITNAAELTAAISGVRLLRVEADW